MATECVVVGRGAIGAIYCSALSSAQGVELRVVADSQRVQRYSEEPLIFNRERLDTLKYTTPKSGDRAADIIIITTKWSGLQQAIELIRPIVSENTLILPLLNGIMPYQRCVEEFGSHRVLRGFFIGTTAIRSGAEVTQSGRYRTVIEPNRVIEELFTSSNIKYRVEPDMEREQWQKLVINIGLNQSTAQYGGLSYGELMASEQHLGLCRALMDEAAMVAGMLGIERAEELAPKAMELLLTLSAEDYSSMAQDVRAGRETEWEIFGGYILALAEELALELPVHSAYRIENNF